MNNLKALNVLGRVLYSSLFIFAGLGHFSAATIGYAASQGVPYANLVVPLSGVMAIVGGLSILLGFQTRLGALLIAAFLIPVTFAMHAFWTVTDPAAQQLQMAMFLKNISLLGGAILIFVHGSGVGSVDKRESVPHLHEAA